MPIDRDTGVIRWRLHLQSSPDTVYDLLATDSGRARFWAESAVETDGVIDFRFPNGFQWSGKILERQRPERFAVDYFSAQVNFSLTDDGAGGTDLLLEDLGELDDSRHETLAGWVSVLMALKAAADHGIDLRNHDPERSWDHDYVDN